MPQRPSSTQPISTDARKTVLFFCEFAAAGGSAEEKTEDAQEEDREEVFTVELHRGPHGLGLALVDGMVSKRPPQSTSSQC